MKNILNKIKLLSVVILAVSFTACSSDDDGPTTPTTTIVDVAIENDLTLFTDALEATDLMTTLQDSGSYTVFAPSNEAFAEFLTDANIDLSDMTATETTTLRNTLMNHVIESSTITSTQLINDGSGYIDTGADGPEGKDISMFYNAEGNSVMLNGIATVTDPDKTATNGVLHIVNNVIYIPDVVTFVTADPNFESLEAALTTDEQSGLLGNLSLPLGVSPTPVTVFAPENAAFQALLDSNEEWNSITDINPELLTSVLEHHIITEQNIAFNDLTNGISAATLEGDMITINIPGNDGNSAKITDGSGNTDINIVRLDIQASNGVIHTIETVLLPDTTN